jgi:transmembrane sensor
MTQEEFAALLQRYLDGHCLPGEQQLVEQWSAQLGHTESRLLPLDLRPEVRAAIWQRIAQATADENVAAPPRVRQLPPPVAFWRPARRWAAAALLVLGLGAGWWLPHHSPGLATPPAAAWVQHTNTSQRAQSLRLADGSRVSLAAGSTLRHRSGLAGPRREVYLTGRAFFNVTKNPAHPFLVLTDKVIATVLGTSFLVTAYPGQEVKVAVHEGQVAVQARQGAVLTATPAQPAAGGMVVLPNQQIIYSAVTRQLNKTLVDNPVVLVPQGLTFKKQPVTDVLAALSKAYGVNIVYDPVKLRNCTVTIDLDDESLFEQLSILCKVLNSSYKMANNAQIIFDGSNCRYN